MADVSIPEPPTTEQPRPRLWIRLSPRTCIAIYGAVGLSGAMLLWYVWIWPFQRHARAYARIQAGVESLAHRRPANVSRNQWSFIIGWTMNGIGNCLSVDGFLNPDAFSHEHFQTLPDRFEQRLQGEVSLETVDWLWNEMEFVSKYGKRYSSLWRPTTEERLKQGDDTPVGNSGPVVD